MNNQARQLLMTAKVFQFCADIFAVFGLFLFAYIYFSHWKDNPLTALRDPFFIVTMLIPFMPAALLAFVASRKRKQVRSLLEQRGKTP